MGYLLARRFPGLECRFIAKKSHLDLNFSGMYFCIVIGRQKRHMGQYGIGRVIDRHDRRSSS